MSSTTRILPYAAAREQIAMLEGSAKLHVVELAALVGRPVSELPPLTPKPLPSFPAALPDDVKIDLIARRADITASRWRVEAAEKSLASARAEFYPDVSINALLGVSSLDVGKLLEYGSRVPQVSAAIHLPIFDAGRLKARYGGAQAAIDVGRFELSGHCHRRRAGRGHAGHDRAQIEAQRTQRAKQVEAALRMKKAAAARVRQGLSDSRSELMATETWIDQRDGLLQLDSAALSADIALQRALGGGYESPAKTCEFPFNDKRIMNANIEASAANPPNGKRRRILLLIALIFIVHWALWAAYWVLVLEKREKTDDAYVNGNRVVISAQVAGTVIAVLADDTQLVNAGQVLVKLDPTDAQTALSRAASALAQAVRQVRQQKATAAQYDSEIETRKLELSRAQIDLAKREPLVAEQAIAGEEVRHARGERALGARRAGTGASASRCPRMRSSTAPRWRAIRRCCRPRTRIATRGSRRSAMRSSRRSPAMSPSAACNWGSIFRRAKRS